MARSSVQLAQQYTNNGTVNASGGSLSRVDIASCPAIGKVGVIDPISHATPTSVASVPSLQAYFVVFLALAMAAMGCNRIRRGT